MRVREAAQSRFEFLQGRLMVFRCSWRIVQHLELWARRRHPSLSITDCTLEPLLIPSRFLVCTRSNRQSGL